jgi:hypothetical protein
VAVVKTGNREMRKRGFIKRCGKMEEEEEEKRPRRNNAFRVFLERGIRATRAERARRFLPWRL